MDWVVSQSIWKVWKTAKLFSMDTSSVLPESIQTDMAEFCKTVQIQGVPLKQMGIPLTLDDALDLLRHVYSL